jgi:serine/threonine protein kinase
MDDHLSGQHRDGVQVSSVLEIMHRMNFAHLDVKPANILQSKWSDRIFKLADYGNAVRTDGEWEVLEGDRAYLPLELLQGHCTDKRAADIFSLGISVLELAMGKPLPQDGDEYHILRSGKLPALSYSQQLCSCIKVLCPHDFVSETPDACLLSQVPATQQHAVVRSQYFKILADLRLNRLGCFLTVEPSYFCCSSARYYHSCFDARVECAPGDDAPRPSKAAEGAEAFAQPPHSCMLLQFHRWKRECGRPCQRQLMWQGSDCTLGGERPGVRARCQEDCVVKHEG